ncbi:hypothetical protein N825_22905 [Skermanella stibiiresistens SB22]|uniref:Uncharacterized protein n=1 Tax=Skermanella stibiiresistens SB22 TaxID=1385369 RepID=W9GSU5_9PROT|nr:hypothetical protein [Skermanella stibiiresistens]EWY36965.1 hypothetical protein N825_22905 [Skermanella stibiiresistens SB22]
MTTEKTGAVVVRVDRSASGEGGAVPVEIRDLRSMVVRARGFSDQRISLSPGSYLVTATLPDGEQAAADSPMEIGADVGDEALEVILSSLSSVLDEDLSEGSPMEFDAVAVPPSLSIPALVIPLSRDAQDKSEVPPECELIQGSWLDYWMNPNGPSSLSRASSKAGMSTLTITREDQPCLLRVTQGDQIRHFAIPVDHAGPTTITLCHDPDRQPAAELDFGRADVNAFFRYVDLGFAPEARFMSKRTVDQAESFLGGNRPSILGGILGGYVLLRANEIDFMRCWMAGNSTEHLMSYPDVRAIRIEFLAREGRHPEAVRELLKLPDAGAPWFRSGIAYLADRARTYMLLAQRERDRFKSEGHEGEPLIPELDLRLSADVHSRLTRLDATLSRLTSALDLRSTTSVYLGLRPSLSDPR